MRSPGFEPGPLVILPLQLKEDWETRVLNHYTNRAFSGGLFVECLVWKGGF